MKLKRQIRVKGDVQRDVSKIDVKDMDHDEALAKDFDENRASYHETELYGVKVFVKVKTK